MNTQSNTVGWTPRSAAGALAGFNGARHKKLLTLAGAILTVALATMPMPADAPILTLTATTDNVTGAHDSIKIDLIRWSTNAERDELLSAWTNPVPPAAAGRGGRGRGAAGAVEDPFGAGNDVPPGGRGQSPAVAGADGRGGRGGGRGGNASADAARPTPESSLKAALDKANTAGYLWSSEVAGYALRYAVRLPGQDGGERILLITDRRLGASNDLWKPAGPSSPGDLAANYEFSLIELRLNAKGEGEGKISLTGKVAVDPASKTFALENYGALPVVLKNVKKQSAIGSQQSTGSRKAER